jgi:photosystem II stability/assembly factor-like uncharacterized protein
LRGIVWSGDAGGSWSLGFEAQCTWPAVFAAGADGTIYLGGFPIPSCGAADDSQGGVFASADGGLTWEERNSGLDGLDRAVFALALDPATNPVDPPTLYAAGLSVSRSTDGGAAWHPVSQPASGASGLITALAVGSGHPATLYAGVRGAVFASNDAGAAWSPLAGLELAGQNVDALVYDPVTRILYAATRSGLFSQVTAAR